MKSIILTGALMLCSTAATAQGQAPALADLPVRLLPVDKPQGRVATLPACEDLQTGSLSRVEQDLEQQIELLRQQNALLLQLLPAPPKQHRKVVRVALRVLGIVDHAGSIASITSSFGVVK